MKKEALGSVHGDIRISIATLATLGVTLTPILILTAGLRFAPWPVAAGLAAFVLLVLVLQQRRVHTLDRLLSRDRRRAANRRDEQRQLQKRLGDLEARVREVAAQRARSQQRFDTALRQARDNTAAALAQIVTMRDPVTGTHLDRLREYVQVLTEQLARGPRDQARLDDDVQRCLPRASMLHDIGKVGIPDAILQKPARLSAEEFAVIQRHPIIGGRTLEKLCQLDPQDVFLKMAHEIALHHHERWDGSGYPFALAQEAIPLSARIVALADVYDALTSERPYKRAYSHEVTRGLIIAQSGSHFDPVVVQAFLAREVDFMRIREAHADISGAVRASRLAPVPQRQEDAAPETTPPVAATAAEPPAQPQLRIVTGTS